LARLVIVSNRVSRPSTRATPQAAGGLAVAMRDALRASGGMWFGWSGEVVEHATGTPQIQSQGGITYVTIDLGRDEHRDYYLDFANSTLWPLLHYRLGLIVYRRHAFERYREVNRRLARTLCTLLQPDDLVWVHDYHLIPLGAELRELGVANRVGFFLHTPFPPPEVLEALPHHETLVRALCAYDLVGFQTEDGVRAFLACIERFAHGRDLGDGVYSAYGVRSRAAAFPISIDTEAFERLAERVANAPETQRLRESLAGRALVIGADRLDYSKGIPNRCEAIDALLTEWPQYRSRFQYLQVTPHSRAEVAQYRALRREVESAVGRVNGRFAEFDWTPIRYINKSLSRRTLAGFYRLARIGLVTPLRDGQNLVAKEFVAAQDPSDPGVLILSRFAGSARELDQALLVNPIDIDDIAAALHRGFEMPLAERQERWAAMMSVLRRNDLTYWRESFVAALRASVPVAAARPADHGGNAVIYDWRSRELIPSETGGG
jgi:trehalose 6-phosphate synthase